MSHEQLVETAKDAITNVFGDTSVSRETTRESLEELRDYVNTYLDDFSEDDGE